MNETIDVNERHILAQLQQQALIADLRFQNATKELFIKYGLSPVDGIDISTGEIRRAVRVVVPPVAEAPEADRDKDAAPAPVA